MFKRLFLAEFHPLSHNDFMEFSWQSIVKTLRQGEFSLALGVMGILVLLFVPVPAVFLDLLFTINITAGVIILLTVLFIHKAMEFSAFPMLLLITTMLRLSLNVASTRLILTDGHEGTDAAGQIIQAFGDVVMQGQFVVGIVIFLVLVIVNFVVITKGATRIAEVAARFTLDSLPGKQMAIDADLNAGLITEDDARSRRSELEQETGFYGAMDGASKFVRGDAIAGLIITGLNVVVGITVGMTAHEMAVGEAADRYVQLTVGDGLVAQIPALIISTASGMLVAKSGTNQAAGSVVFKQIGGNPNVLFVAAGVLILLSLIPNMPGLPFWFLAGSLGTFGYYMKLNESQQVAQAQQEIIDQQEAESIAEQAEEPISSILHIDTLRLELGYGLLGLIDESKGGKLTDQIKAMRRQMAKDIGFVVPSIRIQDNMNLQPGEYSLSIKDISAGDGSLQPGRLLAITPPGVEANVIDGEDTTDPTFGLPAKWIDETKKEDAQMHGFTVVDGSTVITTHLTEVIKDNLSELLTRNETEVLIDQIRGTHDKLVDELIPGAISMGVMQKVLQNLLSERISIRDLPTILEALSDAVTSTKNITLLTEQVRSRLGRQICNQHLDHEQSLPVITLSGTWEKEFMNSVQTDGDDRQLAMEPTKVQGFIRAINDAFEAQMMAGVQAILLTSPHNRPFVRSLLERTLPNIAIMSQSEIHPKVNIRTVGQV